MLRLYGFKTQNSLKTLYVLEESGLDYEYKFVDLGKGEHHSDEFKRMTPVRKVPLLEHEGDYLFESGAICRYIGNLTDSSLYPAEKMARAKVDQWMDFFSIHLGHWLTVMFYEKIIKPKFGLGEANAEKVEEAEKFAGKQLKMLNGSMEGQEYLANNAFSITDLFAFAYVEQHEPIAYSIADFPNVAAWKERVESRTSIQKTREMLQEQE